MKKPSDLLNPIQTRGDFRQVSERAEQESKLRSASAEIPADHPIWDIWAILAEKFGAQWTYGDEPSMGWVHALRDMAEDNLRRGVDNLAHRDDNHWPPNAEEFADLCRMDFNWERQAHKVLPPALEDKTAKEELRALGIEQLALLRKETGL